MAYMIVSENMKEVECYTESEMKNLFIQEQESSSPRFLNLPELYLQDYKTFKIKSNTNGLLLIPINREEISVFCNKEDEINWVLNNKKIVWNNYKIPDFIVGLKSMFQWYDPVYKKNIFILGEYHNPVFIYPEEYTERVNKVRSDKFIIDWITKIPRFVDFYLEINPIDNVNINSMDAHTLSTIKFSDTSFPINIIRHRFIHCFSRKNKNQCRDIGRFHYIDFRPYVFEHTIEKVEPLVQFIINMMKTYVNYFIRDVSVDIDSLLNEFRSIGNIHQSLNFINQALWDISKCEKQLRSINDPVFVKQLRNYAGALYEEYSTDIASLFELTKDTFINNDTRNILELFMDFFAVPMDCYTLARMYKTTIIKQDYIIVFSGDNHSGRYNHFLKHRCHLIKKVVSKQNLTVSTEGFNFDGI